MVEVQHYTKLSKDRVWDHLEILKIITIILGSCISFNILILMNDNYFSKKEITDIVSDFYLMK